MKNKLLFLLIIIFLNINLIYSDCAWDNCHQWSNDDDVINLHIVPHSHDDAGWLKTVDQYFTGDNSDPLVHVSVFETITNIVTELTIDPKKKFTQCEVSFLYRWMMISDQQSIQNFINLVNNGQIELVCGGWVQPDEAASHYVDLIDQYTLGLRYLNSTIQSECSKLRSGWQIDPFGHSREHANILALMGFGSVYFGREHWKEHIWRKNTSNLEFNWYTSNEEPSRKLLGGAFFEHYGAPVGMDWDYRVSAFNPIIDNPRLEGYNVDFYKDLIITHINLRMQTQKHNHVLFLMGGDFQYSHANLVYTQLDKLIKIANNITEKKINAFYSTPNCYTQGVLQSKKNWVNKTADFFPYADKEHSYWTGYFTSKPAFKGLVRQSSNLINTVNIIGGLANKKDATEYTSPEFKLQQASGLVQHHDSVTGTSQEFVTQNYIYRLLQGWTEAENVLTEYLGIISKKVIQTEANYPKLHFCRNINESQCQFTQENSDFAVTIINSMSKTNNILVRIPIYETSIAIIDHEDNQVENAWIIPVFDNQQISNPHHSSYEAVFYATVPPLGFITYFIEDLSKSYKYSRKQIEQKNLIKDTNSLSNDVITVNFDNNGFIENIVDIKTGEIFNLKQEFLAYNGHIPKPVLSQTSGAYVFRPEHEEAESLARFGTVDVIFTYLEARQVFDDHVSQNIRLFPGEKKVEFEWTIGPLPFVTVDGMNTSQEVITRYTTNIQSNLTFYTDSNGRQMMKRVKDYAPDFDYIDDEPVSGNYYPVTSSSMIKDDKNGFVVVTDRSQAVGSLKNGELEFLIHRRDLYDDGYGVRQPLNEPGKTGRGLVVRGKHWIYFGSDASIKRPELASEMFHQPIISFTNYSDIYGFTELYATKYSGLIHDLPANIKILTLKKLTMNTMLLRLEHIYGINDDPNNLSKPVNIDLTTLFKDLKITTVKELLLGGNIYTNDNNIDPNNILLKPLQIITLEITVQN